MPRVLVGYADIMGGLRAYYARREGSDGTASFSAVMVMTALLTVNLCVAVVLIDLWLFGEMRASRWLNHHRGVYLLVALGVAGAHALLARATGVFVGGGAAIAGTWTRRFLIYVSFTAFLFLAAFAAIAVTRRH